MVAALIFIDIALKRICRRDVRMLQNHRFLAGSLGLGSGVMVCGNGVMKNKRTEKERSFRPFGIGVMTLAHWIMHRFNSNSPSGIEHSESIQYFMPPEEGQSHQRHLSHHRYSTPFQHQHAQYAPNPYFSSKNNSKHDDEEDDYHDHDTESRYQDSEYVDDEVTSLLNNAFLQIGATPASQIEEAMHRRQKKELQRQRRQRPRGRQGSSDLEHDGQDHDHGSSGHHSDHHSDSSDDEPESIEVVIEDPHLQKIQGLDVSNISSSRGKKHTSSSSPPLLADSSSSWSSVSSDTQSNVASNKVAANGKNKSDKPLQDSDHLRKAHHKQPTALDHESAVATPPPPPVHHTYQTFAPPSVGGKSGSSANMATSTKGLPQYPYSNHSRGTEEASQGTLRRTSFPRLNHTYHTQHQHHHPSQSRGHPTLAARHQRETSQPGEHRSLLDPYGRRGSDPLTSSRHDILDHAATDDGEHTELTDIGLQTALTIAIHKFPEGLITFLSTTADPCLGLSVFMALAVHNLIEGYLIAFPLYIGLRSRAKAFAFAAALGGLSQPIGALLGWFILRKVVSLGWQVSAAGVIYAMVAGMMASIAVNGMWPQAVKCAGRQPTKVVPISFFTGIAIMGICQAVMSSKCKT
ncbi:hypothetical protein BGZ73_003155 [Actinomortierella ambigua]|nr:hypothetical protein BGZ73_003155 [Actinomortierella ambigua]